MRHLLAKISILIPFILFFAQSSLASDRLPVFVSILPQKYFVQQIGGDLVDVRVMVQPGANPATYEPKPQQMVALSKARAYFAIGVPFEKTWLNKISAANPGMSIIHMDQGIEKIPMTTYGHFDEGTKRNGTEQEHEKNDQEGGVLDPHIWLSPDLAKILAKTILRALKEIDPVHGDGYEANYRALISVMVALDMEFRNLFSDKRGLQFMVFHPSWGYFARTYGLDQVPIELEGKEPKPGQLKSLIEYARDRSIRIIFVQPQFSNKSARLLAREIGGEVVMADPLAEDWPANLREVAQKFRAALR